MDRRSFIAAALSLSLPLLKKVRQAASKPDTKLVYAGNISDSTPEFRSRTADWFTGMDLLRANTEIELRKADR